MARVKFPSLFFSRNEKMKLIYIHRLVLPRPGVCREALARPFLGTAPRRTATDVYAGCNPGLVVTKTNLLEFGC